MPAVTYINLQNIMLDTRGLVLHKSTYVQYLDNRSTKTENILATWD